MTSGNLQKVRCKLQIPVSHLGHRLRVPAPQNKLTDVISTLYTCLVDQNKKNGVTYTHVFNFILSFLLHRRHKFTALFASKSLTTNLVRQITDS